MTRKIILFTDGAARGNPGPAAIGIVLTDERGNEIEALSETIGNATNNEAEYRALLRGLERAAQHADTIEVRTDSELLVRQLNGAYKVRAANLTPLHAQAQRALKRFKRATIAIIPRELNRRADALANEALDEKTRDEKKPLNQTYYNGLAPYYKLIYPDWDASIARQATALDGVIREFFGKGVRHILDAACGIGTQSIGLAQLGYTITASDISPAEIEQARAETIKRGLSIEFRVADMRQLHQVHQNQFDLVIACDNAVPHLSSEDEIRHTFEQFYQCTTSNGGCIISVRDYANTERGGRRLYPRLAHETTDGRIVIFDLWDFDGDYYDITTYVVEDKNQLTALTQVIRGGRYYCVTITTLERLLAQVGFKQVTTLRDRFFQPLIVGVK
jgi:ribonuclease HI